ncbi:MAG TPA: SIMPL domain-containing protein [Blastocatellia bacterium]|nr:SIMPL domain-containing protein [Blastocatellia bacterium]
MKKIFLLVVAIVACVGSIQAQTSGNVAYSEKTRIRPHETPSGTTQTPDGSVYIEAYVLFNGKADEYVATFSASQEGRTIHECNQKLASQIQEFSGELKAVGIKDEDIDVDFVVQNRVYDYQVNSGSATEKLSGFEIKKNIAVHYKEKGLLDNLTNAAAKANIFDLIKVDYVIDNPAPIRERLLKEGARIIREKEASYENLFGLKFRSPVEVTTEKYETVYPKDQYDSYTAFETGQVDPGNSQTYRVTQARKNTTFFFNGSDPGLYDLVINPVVSEPMIQISMYLRVRRMVDR